MNLCLVVRVGESAAVDLLNSVVQRCHRINQLQPLSISNIPKRIISNLMGPHKPQHIYKYLYNLWRVMVVLIYINLYKFIIDMSGLAKEKLLQLLLDITKVMLQTNEFSLSEHEVELIKLPEIKNLQLINQIKAQNTQYSQESAYNILYLQIQHKVTDKNRTAHIKMYCRLIIAAITDSNSISAQKYIGELLRLIENRQDLQKINYFLCGVTSLLALKYYSLQHNKEYKYDLNTQALLAYILSNLQPQNTVVLRQKFNKLYEEIEQTHLPSKLLEAVHKVVNDGENNRLIDDLMLNLMQIELKLSKKIQKRITIQSEPFMSLVDNIIEQKKMGNRKLIEVLNLLKETQNYPFFKLLIKDLSQTRLLKKIKQHKTELQSPKAQAEKCLKIYLQKRQAYGLGDIVKYKRCEGGMSLLKYNYRNCEVGWRYVRIGEDGIFWGKQTDKCPLKCSWEKVQALAYGKVSKNIVTKCKYISSDNIFSLILRDRSIDFICQNEEEVVTWLQGIAFILNKRWRSDKSKKILFTRGSILWNKLFMKLSNSQAELLLNKSSGIIKKDPVVKYKLKQRGLQIKQ